MATKLHARIKTHSVMVDLWRHMHGRMVNSEYVASGYSELVRTMGTIERNDVRDMEIRYFDMTLNDGRVYRVRVSDITPEGE